MKALFTIDEAAGDKQVRRNKRKPAFVLAGIFFLSMVGCDKFPALNLFSQNKSISVEGTVIAKVNGVPITLEQLDQEIKSYNDAMTSPELRITTTEQKLTYLNDELVRRHLFYEEAKKRGLDKKAKTIELINNVEVNILANQLLEAELNNIVVTSSEIEDFYNLYKDQYQLEEERKIREIVLDDEAAAKDALIELLKGADFSSLAKERSRAASASSGGDLGFIKRGQRGADYTRFDAVAFSSSLDIGQASNVFKEKGAYYIIKVEDKKGGQPKQLSEAWDDIKRNVLFLKQQQKLQEITSRLLKNANVVLYKDRVK
jgi:peptidyl-prolyl cis-trans isomerase C